MSSDAIRSDQSEAQVDVVLIEDQRLFADVIQATLEAGGMRIKAVCHSGTEGQAAALAHQPDLVLIDMRLPDRDGFEVGVQLLKSLPATKVVALSAHDDPGTVRRAIRAGFAGYLSKDSSASAFLQALIAVLQGKTVFRHRLVSNHAGSGAMSKDIALLVGQLTSREREILTLIVRGAKGPEIARELGVSPNTVRSHVQAVLTKLQVHSRLEAAAFALQHGLTEPSPAIGRKVGP
jgi:DNA-binding NarL/FixJ family response regulator